MAEWQLTFRLSEDDEEGLKTIQRLAMTKLKTKKVLKTISCHFDFEFEDDALLFAQTVNAPDMAGVIYDLDQWLRNKVKWPEDKEVESGATDIYSESRDKLWELINKHGIDEEALY